MSTPRHLEDQADAHRNTLTALCADGGPLTAASANATVNNPDWFVRGAGRLRALPAREQLHDRILASADSRNAGVKQDRQAIVLAGPPGAGKSTAQRQIIATTGTQPEDWRVINSDEFKDDLLEQAIHDGSYREHLVPVDVAELEEAGERFYPRELASLVHEEAGILARRATADAIDRGDNLIIDGVLANERGAHALVQRLADANYQVRVVDVEAPRDIVEARIVNRWREGYLAAEQGTARTDRDATLGGRWVPSAFAGSLYPPGRPDTSVSFNVARNVAERSSAVRSLDVYRVLAPDAGPRLVDQRGRVGNSSTLLDSETLKAAQNAASARPRPAQSRRPQQRGPVTGPQIERD